MSTSETALVAVTSLFCKSNGGDTDDLPQTEKEQATFRFTAAQRLFRQQTRPISYISILQRTHSEPSLHPISTESTDGIESTQSEGAQIVSSPNRSSFTTSFMRTSSSHCFKPSNVHSSNLSRLPLTPVHEGCFILGPRRSLHPLDVTQSIKASTENGNKAWYCRHDKLVIFDGVSARQDANTNTGDVPTKHGLVLLTRSSRGLDIARRNCHRETIRIEIPCNHCQDMLKRKSWTFQERMLNRRVCKNCQDRCWKLWESSKVMVEHNRDG